MPTPVREFLLEKLRALLALPRGQVFAAASAWPDAPSGAAFIPATRLNYVLSGQKTVTLPGTDGTRTVKLAAGDAHFNPANTGELQSWNTRHELLCIVYRRDYLRISHYDVRKCGGGWVPENTYYHTNRPCGQTLTSVITAMETTAAVMEKHATIAIPDQILGELATPLIRLAIAECEAPPAEKPDRAGRICEAVRQYIENEFFRPIGRDDLARVAGLNPGYLSELFRKTTGARLIDVLITCRLTYARTLLEETELSVAQVCDTCGFGDTVHFVRTFRKHVGIAPGRYRQMQRLGEGARTPRT